MIEKYVYYLMTLRNEINWYGILLVKLDYLLFYEGGQYTSQNYY